MPVAGGIDDGSLAEKGGAFGMVFGSLRHKPTVVGQQSIIRVKDRHEVGFRKIQAAIEVSGNAQPSVVP